MKRKVLYLLQCVVMIVLSACSEDDLQSLQHLNRMFRKMMG